MSYYFRFTRVGFCFRVHYQITVIDLNNNPIRALFLSRSPPPATGLDPLLPRPFTFARTDADPPVVVQSGSPVRGLKDDATTTKSKTVSE